MKKKRIGFCIFVAVFIVLIGCSACSDSCTGIDKWEVEIKVSNTINENFYFYLGTDNIEKKYEYTGESIEFGVTAWRMPKSTEYGDIWFPTPEYGPNRFITKWIYTDENGIQHTDIRYVKERGVYSILYYTDTTSSMWYYRSVKLEITVV